MKTVRYDVPEGMKIIPTEKEPGCFVHLTRHEVRELHAELESKEAAHENTPRGEFLRALSAQLARFLRNAERGK